MVKSMTGFGRAEVFDNERKFTVELKSVNHRYLDIGIRMPKRLGIFEGAIRHLLKQYMLRGKVDMFISYEDYTKNRMILKYNRELAKEYLKYFQEMGKEFGIGENVDVSDLARCPEIFTMEEQALDEEGLWSHLEPVLIEAAEKFSHSRETEGANLKKDLLAKLLWLDEKVSQVEARSPQVVQLYREKLEAKTKELLEGTQLEEGRIAAEVVLFADKICNDEETVRLHSHIHSMQDALENGVGMGRKLDFIAQEMNREANTILSKSADLEISNIAIDLKTEIEKIREQIQNIE